MRIAMLTCVVLLASCGGSEPQVPASAPRTAPQEATVRAGDLTLRASVVDTMSLPASVASQYGISRSDDTAMLLIAARKGDDSTSVSVPTTVNATATNLRGGTQSITMRELRSEVDGQVLVDSIGIVTVTPPETMRFDIEVTHPGGTSTMSMTREFYPR